MIKVLIVEDEPLVQIGIQAMIDWNQIGASIIGMCSNGKQALDKIREDEPHIIITDIKMPVLDGLELIREVKRLGVKSEIIVLTNYEEFKVAQEALKLGAKDYLVKLELTSEILKEAINKVKSQIDTSIKEVGYSEDSENEVCETIKRLIYNAEDIEKNLEENKKRLGLEAMHYTLFFIHINQNIKIEQNRIDDKSNNIMGYTLNMIKKIAKNYFKSYSIQWENNSIIMIGETLKIKEHYEEKIRELSQNILMTVNQYFSIELTIGISNVFYDMKDIKSAYNEAMYAVHQHFYDANHQVIYYRDMENTLKYKSKFDMSLFKRPLLTALDNYDGEEIRSIFDELIGLLQTKRASKEQVLDICCQLGYFVFTLLDQGEEVLQSSCQGERWSIEWVYTMETLDEVIKWIKNLCEEFCKEVASAPNTHLVIKKVQQYILENYDQKIVQSEVAEHFNINSAYLSSIFKRVVGLGFSDYVTRIKIKKAQELLEEGHYKIYEVADKLGFDNQYYFSKVFKKVTGVTPKRFISNL